MTSFHDSLHEAVKQRFLGGQEPAILRPESNLQDMLVHSGLQHVLAAPVFSGILENLNEAADRLAREVLEDVKNRVASSNPVAGAVDASLSSEVAELQAGLQYAISKHNAVAKLCTQAGQLQNARLSLSRFRLDQNRKFTHELAPEIPLWSAKILAKARKLSDHANRIRDYFGNSPRLWDLDEGLWQEIPDEGLQSAADTIERFPELQDLARRLGRRSGGEERFVTKQVWQAMPDHELEAIGKEELAGYVEGRDLELLIPQELALLASPGCSELFLQRYADSRLVNRSYTMSRDSLRDHGRKVLVEQRLKAPLDQGPIILCLDSSGSMCGSPELIGKALSLALSRICLAEDRPCYLIAFSAGIQCLDLHQPAQSLQAFSAFLAHAFRGGTDLRPALKKAIAVLADSNYEGADVIVVSDFKVPKILIKKAGEIMPLIRHKKARLHGVSIGTEAMQDDLQLFDTRWHFTLGRDGDCKGMHPAQFHQILA